MRPTPEIVHRVDRDRHTGTRSHTDVQFYLVHCAHTVAARLARVRAKRAIMGQRGSLHGSSWSKVIPLLQARGLHVVAVQLHLASLADDVATTKRAIALQSGPVVLVGHSYGGAVITEAGNDPKVVGLVFVAAFAPGNGESVTTTSKPYPAAPLGGELRPDAQGFLWITPKGVSKDFAQGSVAWRTGDPDRHAGPGECRCFRRHRQERCLEGQANLVCNCRQRSCDSSGIGESRSGENESHGDHAAFQPPRHAVACQGGRSVDRGRNEKRDDEERVDEVSVDPGVPSGPLSLPTAVLV